MAPYQDKNSADNWHELTTYVKSIHESINVGTGDKVYLNNTMNAMMIVNINGQQSGWMYYKEVQNNNIVSEDFWGEK